MVDESQESGSQETTHFGFRTVAKEQKVDMVANVFHSTGEFRCQIARTARKIQHSLAATHAAAVNRVAFPQSVDTERNQVVQVGKASIRPRITTGRR